MSVKLLWGVIATGVLIPLTVAADPLLPFSQATLDCLAAGRADPSADPSQCLQLSTRDCEPDDGFVICASRELAIWQAEVDRTMFEIMELFRTALPNDPRSDDLALSVLDVHSAHEKYVDALCSVAEKSVFGGSGAAPEAMSCILREKASYLQTLREMKARF